MALNENNVQVEQTYTDSDCAKIRRFDNRLFINLFFFWLKFLKFRFYCKQTPNRCFMVKVAKIRCHKNLLQKNC